MTDSVTQAAPVAANPAAQKLADWLARFETALAAQDIPAALALFDADCYWRDLVSFTWNLKTLEGREQIAEMLGACLAETRPGQWRTEEEADATDADGITSGWFTFETALARGRGYVRLRNGLCWTLLTTMTELKGHEEKKGRNRIKGAEHGIHPGRKSWLELRQQEEAELGYTQQPYVLIIGGGQGGIGLGARLRRLGVPTLIIDKHERPGDAWRKRYKSLCLHDPVWYDHLPYLPFPDDWPVFCPKDKIGDWLEAYTKIMELNYWSSTECVNAEQDPATGAWTVNVKRKGEPVTLRPTQVVFALGMSGVPNIPKIPGQDIFKGEQQHSSQHQGGAAYNGKKVVVIGSNNSAHDICAALWEHGADVTMLQRTSTHIAPSDSLMKLALGGLYSEDAVEKGMTTYKADLTFASVPFRIMHTFHIPVYEQMKKDNAEFYGRLEQAGFMLDFGDDGSGLFMKYLRRGSGYYIDVGASELVANGSIKLKSRVGIECLTENGVLMKDGTELPADLVVYATGYGSMNGWVAKLVSQEVADKVGKCWGLGSDTTKDPGPWEGELRNMWKPTQVQNLWFHGGNLHQSRHYSQYVALQLKARYEGMATPVYGLQEVHHKG
ncbi:NAD(P)/FAD-dependent oxidoreductase [Derxia lacustris]|uniref:NAD(P)/FAD-dependent oxidoreductase n=1 Tax=Derxia lacustris TaxID=764842 RepID=UPI000A171009|nr:NAD(P)/FAD-dependent oxidoreductase [Derxia lacustris]